MRKTITGALPALAVLFLGSLAQAAPPHTYKLECATGTSATARIEYWVAFEDGTKVGVCEASCNGPANHVPRVKCPTIAPSGWVNVFFEIVSTTGGFTGPCAKGAALPGTSTLSCIEDPAASVTVTVK